MYKRQFQEFASRKMSREEKPSIRERLTQAKEQAAEKVEHRTIDPVSYTHLDVYKRQISAHARGADGLEMGFEGILY